MSKKKDGKITLGMLKGKPVTTSVPSISIKFHANAEQLEELYVSDEEHGSNETTGAIGVNEPESSPLKLFPRLVKRSTSIDITPNTTLDASPPSDPWRFFSDIKGKITKSVEEKITEIKSRNQEEGSPLKTKIVKDNSKENSSVSDSEDLSESSISKTCGIISTTEGAEMSSDDETPSIEKDKKTDEKSKIPQSGGLRQRFRLLKPKSQIREGSISKKSLASLYNINTEKIEQALAEENEIENAVDALEETTLQQEIASGKILKEIEQQFDNIKIDNDNVVNIKEVNGNEVRAIHWASKTPKTVFAPIGFVDFRAKPVSIKQNFFIPIVTLLVFILTYVIIHNYSKYLAGLTLGVTITFVFYSIRNFLETPIYHNFSTPTKEILVPAVKEFQPLTKYEGWVNEFPEIYNPHTYHISQTQPVFLRLQGNLLRVSHTRSKVPKRALWNEAKIKPIFTHHRVYNLMGAQIELLPIGLAKKRHWSKKYPICITLNKDQMNFEAASLISSVKNEEEESSTTGSNTNTNSNTSKKLPFIKKKRSQTLRFSKLSEENEEFDLDSENSRPSSPSPDESDRYLDEENKMIDEALREDEQDVFDDEAETLSEDWITFTPPDDDSPSPTKLYIFGRTDREKEDWFRRLVAATHKGANSEVLSRTTMSNTLFDQIEQESHYMKFMAIFNKVRKNEGEEAPSCDIQWLNALIGRVLFDCLRDDSFTDRVKDKIQRKLSSIKLPYFIEGLTVTELSLGQTPPLVHKASRPSIDERGLWIDLDITYEGLIVLILQTKLNLMKLKQPPSSDEIKTNEKSAIYNSDVEDSAESSSDEESICFMPSSSNPPALDQTGLPVPGLGGTSNTSKKFMKMVDRIAESKFFQAATEYRYIKKAMEGVSNTELRLKVEVKELVGTLVINIPPPPSDRIWLGFRPIPNLALAAQPIVGERNITYLRITSWIEKKLLLEFQKIMVIPNMEDFIVPVMSPKLPE